MGEKVFHLCIQEQSEGFCITAAKSYCKKNVGVLLGVNDIYTRFFSLSHLQIILVEIQNFFRYCSALPFTFFMLKAAASHQPQSMSFG